MAEYMIQDTTLKDIADAIRERNKTTDEIAVVDMPAKIKENPFGMVDTSSIEIWDYYNHTGYRNETMKYIDTSNGTSFDSFCYNAFGLSEQTFEFHWEKADNLKAAFYFSDVLGLIIHLGKVYSADMHSMFRNVTNLKTLMISGKIKVASNDLNFAYASGLDVDSLLSILNALEDNTGEATQYTVYLGSTNLAKLTEEQRKIATNKNLKLG